MRPILTFVVLVLVALFPVGNAEGKDLDLIFVLDGSSSVNASNFELIKTWTEQVASHFTISNNTTRIGVVQYSHYHANKPADDQPYMKTEIALGSIQNQTQLKENISSIQWLSFTTYTAHALNKTLKDFMTSDRFNSSSTVKVLVLLTDGQADDAQYLNETSAYVKSFDIYPFVVGVKDAKLSQLKMITENTDKTTRLFKVEKFTDLSDNVAPLVMEIKKHLTDECVSNPCQHNGSCIDMVQEYKCNCLPGYTGNVCEIDIDECENLPCQNNGTCLDLVNDFICFCTCGYEGKTCTPRNFGVKIKYSDMLLFNVLVFQLNYIAFYIM